MSAVVPPGEPAAQPPAVPGYTLEALLGRGASGEVWRAVAREGGEPVAVKVLVAGDPARQAREAALLGELDHPHLVRLHEVVHQPRRGGAPRVALVLDLLDGGSLADLLARRGRLRPGEVVTAIAPVAAALSHAHGHGVVHGDLSPGNIVFTAEGRPVLTDLGVARVLGETAAAEVTPAYVDPVVARGGTPGPASDVFGVAAAAFHALTGIAPWNAARPADTLGVAAGGELPDLPELAPEAPPELIAVISRGLAANPHERGSAAAFALDLRRACRPEPVGLRAAPRAAGSGRPDARTELTHVVPGRRPRPAPVVVDPDARRRGRLRAAAASGPLARGLLVAAIVLAALAVTAWAGTRWGGGGGTPATSAVAATSPAPAPAVPTSAAEEPLPGEAAPAEELEPDAPDLARPVTEEEWTAVVARLYERRAAGLSGDPAVLDEVYAPGNALQAADAEHARALAAAGEQLRGFAPAVVDLSVVDATADRAELLLTDRWPDYDVVRSGDPDGDALRTVAGRPDTAVRMVVVRTPEGWRIGSAERVG
ncbi:serine/threonine-protein kinase [Blastococcus xanthinilyticus]|uniref:non-specific serine/threonine protein kinase n=1 Tax=Blastococcus xanthinilyticus TaxID=1564164 RepID=A0A5S5CZ99_9ACTN|nr:serine/threonine-protein kinase [Blastococcus xanthinilyticus]TYP88414.1 serine/threonine protein kinase [Blastococcus xanthinilyticus]